jgi:hypothetical protein
MQGICETLHSSTTEGCARVRGRGFAHLSLALERLFSITILYDHYLSPFATTHPCQDRVGGEGCEQHTSICGNIRKGQSLVQSAKEMNAKSRVRTRGSLLYPFSSHLLRELDVAVHVSSTFFEKKRTFGGFHPAISYPSIHSYYLKRCRDVPESHLCCRAG